LHVHRHLKHANELPRLRDGARLRRVDGGVLVFDPVTWTARLLSDDGVVVLDCIRDLVDSGLTDRESLLAELRREISLDDGALNDRVSGLEDDPLATWVDLALNLFELGQAGTE
jgi:hypothetical protein